MPTLPYSEALPPVPARLPAPVLGSLKALRKALDRGHPVIARRLAARFLRCFASYAGYYHEATSQAFEQESDILSAVAHAKLALDWFQGVNLPIIQRYVRLMRETHELDEALRVLEDGLRRFTGDIILRMERGRTVCDQGKPEEGLALFTELEQDPLCAEDPALHATVIFLRAELLFSLGRHKQAEEDYAASLDIAPYFVIGWYNRLFSAHYMPHMTAEDLAAMPRAAHRALHAHCKPTPAAQLVQPRMPHKGDTPRPLRIGILSAGLRTHPVGWLAGPVLHALHASGDVTLILYYTGRQPGSDDFLRPFFQGLTTDWHDAGGWSDEVLYERLIADKLDIAMDMSGHGDGSRLALFARRIAPIQIKWVGGMCCSSGVPTMDYLLTDAIQTPVGTEALYTEQLVRLPRGYVGYAPPPYMPEVGPPPHLEHGVVTFGCCNNAYKLNSQILELWGRILHRVPNSRLLLKSDTLRSEAQTRLLRELCARSGIAEERLIIEERARPAALLETYNRIDIALDPWPYTGGLSTLEAVWMGVPVITTPGPSFAGHHGAGHLYHAGLEEFIAPDFATYEELAVALATHSEAMVRLRQTLRERVSQSPLLRHDLLAADLLAALRVMWDRACKGLPPAPISLPPMPDTAPAWPHDAASVSPHLDGPRSPFVSDPRTQAVITHMGLTGQQLYLACCARQPGDAPLQAEGIREEWQRSLARTVRAGALPLLETALPGDDPAVSACIISTFILETGTSSDVAVCPDDVVLDCGAGDGHFALWAGMAGARTVWALAREDQLDLLTRNATRYNGTEPWLHPAPLPASLDIWCAALGLMPDYIRMDLGAETLNTLCTAQNLLARHPRMVIRLPADDLHTVPLWLIAMWPECRLNCRLDADERLVLYVS